jgi:hypothetical protein
VVQKEVQLAEINTQLQRHTMPRNLWVGRRWFGYQVSNTTLTAVGALLTGAERFSYLHKNRIGHAPRDVFEHAAWLRVDANIDMTLGAAAEVGLSKLAEQKKRRRGTDIVSLQKKATSLINDTDVLIAERADLLSKASLPPPLSDAYAQEGVVLTDVRNLCQRQFQRDLREAKARRAKVVVQRTFAIAANATSGACAYVGSIYASQQNHVTPRWRTRLGGASGVGDVVAGSLNTLAPLAMSATSRIVKKRMGAVASDEALATKLETDRRQFLEAARHSNVLIPENEQRSFNVLSNVLVELADNTPRFHTSYRSISDSNHAYERLFATSAAGAGKITNGIGGLVGAFHDTKNAHERFEVTGGAAFAYGSAYSLLTVDLIRNQLITEISVAQQHRRREDPWQILDAQMTALKSVEGPPIP